MSGHDSRDVNRFIDVAKVAAHILRVLALGVKAAAMQELDFGILLGHFQDVRIEVAEGGREQDVAPSRLIILRMVS